MDPTEFPEFRPPPLLRGGHAQTILGAYLRSPQPIYSAVRRTVKLEDGDYIVLHDDAPHAGLALPDSPGADGDDSPAPSGWHTGQRVILLVHGLGGSFRSGYMPRVAARLNSTGWRTFRMDLRGWGAGVTLARNAGHAGRSEDLAAALRFVARLCPGSPISLIGFSLGGNLALKLLGEWGSHAPRYLDSVLAVSPPIDLMHCARNIQRGMNWIYDRAFLRSLHRNLRTRQSLLPPVAKLRARQNRPRRLYDFDDRITAPLSGFRDAEDYYCRSSAAPLLRQIEVPTLIISAEDDPIVPAAMYQQAPRSGRVRLYLTRHGGHLGYVGRPSEDPDYRWLDWRIVQWVRQVERARLTVANRQPLGYDQATCRVGGLLPHLD